MTTAAPQVSPSPSPPSVARRVRGSLLNSVAALGASMTAYFLIGRFMDPAEYGRATVILATWGLLAAPLEWGGASLMRFGPVELARQGSLRVSISTRLALAAPALLLIIPGASLYLSMVRSWPSWMVGLTLLWLLLAIITSLSQWCGIAAQRFGALTAGGVLQRGTPVVAVLLLLALSIPVRGEALVLAQIAGAILGAAVPLVAMRSLLGLVRPDPVLLRSMWRYSLPALLSMPLSAMITYLDPLVLDRFVPPAEVGQYQLAYTVVQLFGMIGGSVNNVLSPELVRAGAEGRTAIIETYRRRDQPRVAILLGLAALGGACLAAPLVRAILPDRFAASGDLVATLTVAGGFMMGVWSLHPLVTVTDSVWALQSSTILMAFTNVGLDLLWAPRWGSTGVALANVAAWAVHLVTLQLFIRRRVGASFSSAIVLLPAGAATLLLIHTKAVPPALPPAIGAAVVLVTLGALWRLYCARGSRVSPSLIQ